MRRGDWDAAIGVCRNIAKHDPTHLPALETLAKALWRAHEYDELVSTVRALIGLNPYEPSYHSLLGLGLQCLGRYNEAAAAYRRAGADEQIVEARENLDLWYAKSLATLLETDKVFRAEYARNSVAACESRGFRATDAKTTTEIIVLRDENARTFVRMS